MPAAGATADAKKQHRTITLRLPEDEAARYADLAWSKRSTMSALTREAIHRTYPSVSAVHDARHAAA